MSEPCALCEGEAAGQQRWAYTRHANPCPRCRGTGSEPDAPLVHAALLLRNVRSGKVWAVFGDYPNDWGLHRMKPSCRPGRSYYVWQIIHRPESELLTPTRWVFAGCGDAWDHALMETTLAQGPSA
jgi:hypothetical protein